MNLKETLNSLAPTVFKPGCAIQGEELKLILPALQNADELKGKKITLLPFPNFLDENGKMWNTMSYVVRDDHGIFFSDEIKLYSIMISPNILSLTGEIKNSIIIRGIL